MKFDVMMGFWWVDGWVGCLHVCMNTGVFRTGVYGWDWQRSLRVCGRDGQDMGFTVFFYDVFYENVGLDYLCMGFGVYVTIPSFELRILYT
jgi:hypothetical protein